MSLQGFLLSKVYHAPTYPYVFSSTMETPRVCHLKGIHSISSKGVSVTRDELPVFSVPLQRCVEIQRAYLAIKRSTFGDLSAEVADTLQLIGSVEMTEGRMKQAHRTMTKVIASYNNIKSTTNVCLGCNL